MRTGTFSVEGCVEKKTPQVAIDNDECVPVFTIKLTSTLEVHNFTYVEAAWIRVPHYQGLPPRASPPNQL